ncbi:membrane protein of unknown function [Candidatus Promineifilum breve]|uniref:DUF4203 domain-containing protein n=1 Tax=Candidatus Promineifilum breve TaxID=1806508 RepID=A0A160T1Q4_9CHLR|nr:hypothetical protein [Candidatus Promineifilum breve]CUS03534.2 membrane protein of unknown function [Candidatus Promineifilum breve]
MEHNLIWGLVVLISGIFIASYGNMLFRFVLAFIGFALGFSLIMWVGDGLGQGLQLIVALVAGGIVAGLFYYLVKFSLYIAGGVMGLVIMASILGLFRLAGLDSGIFGWILAAVAAGLGGLFGHRLGNIVIVLATSLAGAYFVVLGLSALFITGGDTEDPLALLGTAFPLVLFATIALISFLAQHQVFSLRQRFLR